MCVKTELFEWDKCVIGNTLSLSDKNSIKCIYFDTTGSLFAKNPMLSKLCNIKMNSETELK